MSEERLWKTAKGISDFNLSETFVKVDNKAFKKPIAIS
jgi:hypothetical protein